MIYFSFKSYFSPFTADTKVHLVHNLALLKIYSHAKFQEGSYKNEKVISEKIARAKMKTELTVTGQ